MSPHIGRPKADNPKDIRFSIRLDSETFARLQQRCERDSLTVAQAIRQAINQFWSKSKNPPYCSFLADAQYKGFKPQR